MKTRRVKTRSGHGAEARRCDDLSLVQLAERIVESDRLALKELHDARPLFRLRNGRPMLLALFVERLCETRWANGFFNGDQVLLEHARDLTIDKYAHMPADEPDATEDKRRAPDCRNAFRSFLRVMEKLTGSDWTGTPLEKEILAAKTLQRRVVRSFQLSCMDAQRRCNPARSRYAWRVNSGVIYVWMPAFIHHLQRRAWLEENVPDADHSRPDERDRVQAIIDDRLGIPSHVSIGADEDDVASRRPGDSPVHTIIEQEFSEHGLAEVVAEEKAANIESQRPAIRALGKPRLKSLILQVFEDLGAGDYEEKRLADAFGVSTATLSRFAGSRWQVDAARHVPDLWVNTAQTLAAHGPFVEAAEEAGVWDDVELILASRKRSQARSHSDV